MLLFGYSEQFQTTFVELTKQLTKINQLLYANYQQAQNKRELDDQYYLNIGFIKEIYKQLLAIRQAIQMQSNILILKIPLPQKSNQQYQLVDMKKLAKNCEQSNCITITHLQSGILFKMQQQCKNIKQLTVKSHPSQLEYMVKDIHISGIMLFQMVSSLSLMGSVITDKGLSIILTEMKALVEIDLSQCEMLTQQILSSLSGNQFISIKLNQLSNLSEIAILNLIAHSYNLNYIFIEHNKHIKYQQFIHRVSTIYTRNHQQYKWLELHTDLGVDMFINKMSYMTQIIKIDNLHDKEVQILLGKNLNLNLHGIFLSSCEQLSIHILEVISRISSQIRRLQLHKFNMMSDSHISDTIPTISNLQYLDVSKCVSFTNQSLIPICEHLHLLSHLIIAYCPIINDEGLIYVCQNLSQLAYLDISFCINITNKSIYAICNYLPQMKSIKASKCEQITDEAIQYVSLRLIHLQELVLNYCQNLTDSSLSLVAIRLKNLKRLEIQWCSVTQQFINLRLMQYLNLSFCPSVCDEEIEMMGQTMPKLRVLKLQSCKKVSTESFIYLSGSLASIEKLYLKQCVNVSDNMIIQLSSKGVSWLKQLDLSWCNLITDKTLFTISQYQYQLTHLNFNGCVHITDLGIQWITSTLKYIQYLNLTLCEQITDQAVKAISQNLSHLRVLYLSQLKQLTDISISSLCTISKLQELHLSGCTQITSSSLASILHSFSRLSTLNISQCNQIEPDNIIIMMEWLKYLKILEVASLSINSEFLSAVAQHLNQLQSINVTMCQLVTDQALIKLMHQNRKLLKIDVRNTNISDKCKQTITHELNARKLANIIQS